MGSKPFSSRMPVSGRVRPVFLYISLVAVSQYNHMEIYLPSSDAQIEEELVFLGLALWQRGTVWCHVESEARNNSWAVVKSMDMIQAMIIALRLPN